MPSGAKKRKAARRKQQQEQQQEPATDTPHQTPPDSPPNPSPPQGNGGSEGSDHLQSTDEEEDSKQDSAGFEVSMETSENGKQEAAAAAEEERADVAIETEETVVVREVVLSSPSEIPVSKSEDVGVEFALHNEGEPTMVGSEEPAAEAPVIPIVQFDTANEEVVHVTESIADTSEAVVDALSLEHEEKVPPQISEALVEALPLQPEAKVVPLEHATVEQPRNVEGSGTPVTTEVTAAPLVVHRATWWNCCGLFDVLTGSQR